MGVGGVAGGTVTWLLRVLDRVAGDRPDGGTTGLFLTTVTFLLALFPGALATALGRRHGARVLLAAGGLAVVTVLVARLGWDRLTGAPAPAVGAALALTAAMAAVVAGAAWATAWLTRSAVGPGGSGLAGPRPPSRGSQGPTLGGGGS
jgi:hypothetical protein